MGREQLASGISYLGREGCRGSRGGGMAGSGAEEGWMKEQAARPGQQCKPLCAGITGSCPDAWLMLPPPCAERLRTQSPRGTRHPDPGTRALTYLRLCTEHAPLTPQNQPRARGSIVRGQSTRNLAGAICRESPKVEWCPRPSIATRKTQQELPFRDRTQGQATCTALLDGSQQGHPSLPTLPPSTPLTPHSPVYVYKN